MAAPHDDSDNYVEDSEISGGNRKEFHYHGNGSDKIVWAWACGATGLICAIIGIMALHFASEQSATNQNVANAITNQSVSIGKLETRVEGLSNTVSRLERTVDRQ